VSLSNSTIRIAYVVAVARNGVIGAGGKLVWRIADDMKWFKKVTMGKPMVMGRKTFESIGKALPGRDNIVITRDQKFAAPDVRVVHTIDDALMLAYECAQARGADEICIIGGGEIYAQLLPRTDRIYLSKVDAEIAGNTYFPALDSAEWSETRESACAPSDKNQYACEFVILDRRAGSGEIH